MNTTNSNASLAASSTADSNATVTAPTAPSVPTGTVAPKKQAMNARDTCSWYTGVRCSMPRDCYDCLNIAVRKDECAVDPSGTCVSIDSYKYVATQRGKLDDPSFLGYFPAANFTYCTGADDACQDCKQRWRQSYADTRVAPTGNVCRGANGCVCIAACEMPDRTNSILSKQCSVFGVAGPRSKLLTQIYLGTGLFCLLLLCIVVFKAWFRSRAEDARAEARRERRERRRNRPLRTGPPLALTGWTELREKLLEAEREFLEGGGKLVEPGVRAVSDDNDENGGDSVRDSGDVECGSVHDSSSEQEQEQEQEQEDAA